MKILKENPITNILAQQLIPSIIEDGAARMIVARSSFNEFRREDNLPLGMRMTHRPLQSCRIKVRGKYYFGKSLLVNARWSEDGLHSLRTPKMAVILKGDTTFQCGNTLLHCKPGHIIFIPPDTPHPDGTHNYLEETAFPQGNCDVLFVGIHADGIAVWLSVTRQGKHYSDGTYRLLGKQTELYFSLLWEQAISTKKYSYRNSGALLLLLMTSIYHELREYQLLQVTRGEVDVPGRGSITRAKDYIHNYIYKKLTIDEVARHVYLSRTQFTSQFRRETGKTFHEYLSECRFEMAKTLLLDPLDWPINHISRRIGLKPGMLRKLFKQRLQMSPSQFRENRNEVRETRPPKNKIQS